MEWLVELRHKDLTLMDLSTKVVTRTHKHTTLSVCCLANLEIPDNDFRVYKWRLKITRVSPFSQVFVGICQEDLAREHSLIMWPWDQIGHGHYCVSSDGYVFSSCDPTVNYASSD